MLTHKAKSKAGRHKVRVELETTVENGEQMDAILRALGFAPTFRYEKYRAEWSDGNGHVVLDETPIGNFGEIEGPPRWIDRTARALGIRCGDYITHTYAPMFFAWKRATRSAATEMTFRARRQEIEKRLSQQTDTLNLRGPAWTGQSPSRHNQAQRIGLDYEFAPQHFLYFLPLPQGQGSLRPTLSPERTTCCTCMSPAPAMRACSSSRFFLRWKASSISSTEVATWRGGRPLPPRPPVITDGTPASGPWLDRPFRTACRGIARLGLRRTLQDLHQVQIANRLFLEALHHLFEHVEGLALVLDQRIVLPVAAQADAFFQVVHARAGDLSTARRSRSA